MSAERNYRFPPFPPAPEGVKIIPFGEFKEWGTRVVGADRVERDGQGIPTLALPKSKKKQKKTAAALNAGKPRLEWWEEWKATNEHLARRGPYDIKSNRLERFHQASADFQKFHNVNIRQYVKDIWGKFQIYVGIGSEGLKLGSKNDDEMSDDASDDDEPAAFADNDHFNVSPAEKFLDDPVQRIRIFLSSYMRDAGLMWDPLKLDAAPRLLRFFVDFLLRNEVVPESKESLQGALDVIARAAEELPLTPVVSKVLRPGAFSDACVGCWGSRLESGFVSDEDGEGQPEAKRAKLSHATSEKDGDGDAVLEGATIEEVHDDAKVDVQQNSGWGGGGGWEASSEGQGTAESNAIGGWGGGGSGDWGRDADSWPNTDSHRQERELDVPTRPRPTLLTLLGPTALPLTHRPGIVESSLRRVKHISLPPSTIKFQDTPTAAGVSADDETSASGVAVERRLASRMGRVVLAPWLDWDPAHPEASAPRILSTSRSALASVNRNSDSTTLPAGYAHDMLRDDITLLVEPIELETSKLCVGMGLDATWVQLAHVNEGADGQEGGSAEKYWYQEELVLVLPSFWAV